MRFFNAFELGDNNAAIRRRPVNTYGFAATHNKFCATGGERLPGKWQELFLIALRVADIDFGNDKTWRLGLGIQAVNRRAPPLDTQTQNETCKGSCTWIEYLNGQRPPRRDLAFLNEGQFPDSDKLHWERAKREIEEEDRALLEKNGDA